MTVKGERTYTGTERLISAISRIIPPGRVLRQEPMSGHTSFRIGGPAAAMVICADEAELASVLRECASAEDTEYMIIGNGSNFLVADRGYPGIMIRLGGSFDSVSVETENADGSILVRAGAAKLLSGTCAFLTEHGLTGMEFASGIPGSIGGAVFMNAGAYGGEMKDVVTSVRMMRPDGSEVIELSADEMEFGYRHSIAEESGLIVLSALLRLGRDEPEAIASRVKELHDRRNSKQPVSYPSAGSTFKRPVGGYAAALIDEAGLKGYRCGGAMVSEKHAGFVINTGGATAEDVLEVMRHVRKVVYENSGILLEPEVRLIGCEL